jgi:hypothetical protein
MAVLENLEERARSAETEDQLAVLVKIRNRPRGRRTRLLKGGSGATGCVAIGTNIVDISTPEAEDAEPLGVSVVGGTGTVLRGPVGFTNSPSSIRIAGLWVLNDLLLSAAPSTIMTPIPVMQFSPPLEAVALYVKTTAVVAAMAGLL